MAQTAPVFRCVIDVGGDSEVELDATLSERHKATVELTRHPVEEGASPVDHARVLPEGLDLDAVVTNVPIGRPKERSTPPGEVGYAQQSYAKLLALKNARRAVKVKTNLRTYENMVMTALSPVADMKTGDAIRMSITFDEIRFVRSERVRLERVSAPTSEPTKPVNKTDQGKTPPENASEDDRRSILKSGFDFAGITKAGSGKAPR